MRKVAIFGGSFDPLHNGHLEIIRRLSESNDIVYVVPTTIRYYKKNDNMFSFQERFSSLVSKTQGYDNVKVLDIEREVNYYWRYYNTLLKIAEIELNQNLNTSDEKIEALLKAAGIELFTAMGSDSYLDFKTWDNWERISKLSKLIVFNRPSYNIDNFDIECEFVKDMHCEQSSTKLREKINMLMTADNFDDYLGDCGWALDENGDPIDFDIDSEEE